MNFNIKHLARFESYMLVIARKYFPRINFYNIYFARSVPP
jgi:hypothetical protein